MQMLNLEKLSILVVEDNKPMQVVIKTILSAMRIKSVYFCEDATEAVKEMRIVHPDIVITDYNMQPLDGLGFVRLLRWSSDSPDPFVPVILLTVHTEMHHVLEARDAGVNEVLAKPISIKTLYTRIVNIIENPRPFVHAKNYKGPDRRRKVKDFIGPERRDAGVSADGDDQATDAKNNATAFEKENVPS